MDTQSQIRIGRGVPTQIQYQQQATPVNSEYSFVRDSTYVPVPAQPRRYHQHKPAPHLCPRTRPRTAALGILYKYRYSPVSVFPLGRATTGTACCAQTQRIQRMQQTQAPRALSPFSKTSTTNTATNTNLPSTATTRIKVTCIRSCTRISIPRQVIAYKCQSSPRYSPQFSHDPYLSGYYHPSPLCVNHNAHIRLLVPWPHSVLFGRLHRPYMFARMIGFSGTSLACDFLLCVSRSRFHSCTDLARFLVVHGAMLEETSIVFESSSVISLRV